VSDDGIPGNLDSLALQRIADALEGLLELKRKDLAGEITPHYAKAKDPKVWVACRTELLRLLEEHPFVDWEIARKNPVFRDMKIGNMYREVQWARFLEHHAIPNKPDDGSAVQIVAFGKTTKFEAQSLPTACIREGSTHCAEAALNYPNWSPPSGYNLSPSECSFCAARQAKIDEYRKARAAGPIIGEFQ
jgi:hypothetical protein